MLLFPAGYFHFSKKAASNACGYPDSPTRLLRDTPKPPLNAEFHSAAARSTNAFNPGHFYVGQGLFCITLFRQAALLRTHSPGWRLF